MKNKELEAERLNRERMQEHRMVALATSRQR
jgi:hypothetical protein